MSIDTTSRFPNISGNLDNASTRCLPFEEIYYQRLKEIFFKMGYSRDEFFNPAFIWEILSSEKVSARFPNIEIDIIRRGIFALEFQLKKQIELYENVENPLDYKFNDKSLIFREKKDSIYEYLRHKMETDLFIVSRNRKFSGTFSFHDIDMNMIIPRYTTLPNLEIGDYFDLDVLFIKKPKDFSSKPSRRRVL